MGNRAFVKRPLAFTDIETTGLDAEKHEIIELGLVVVDQTTLQVQYTMDYKVKPSNIETASPKALEINGYNAQEWKKAEPLESVTRLYARLTEGSSLAAWNYEFEMRFLRRAAQKTRTDLKLNYHNRGIETLAAEILRNVIKGNNGDTKALQKENMEHVAEFLGLKPEPKPHRAIDGAFCCLEIYKKLRSMMESVYLKI